MSVDVGLPNYLFDWFSTCSSPTSSSFSSRSLWIKSRICGQSVFFLFDHSRCPQQSAPHQLRLWFVCFLLSLFYLSWFVHWSAVFAALLGFWQSFLDRISIKERTHLPWQRTFWRPLFCRRMCCNQRHYFLESIKMFSLSFPVGHFTFRLYVRNTSSIIELISPNCLPFFLCMPLLCLINWRPSFVSDTLAWGRFCWVLVFDFYFTVVFQVMSVIAAAAADGEDGRSGCHNLRQNAVAGALVAGGDECCRCWPNCVANWKCDGGICCVIFFSFPEFTSSRSKNCACKMAFV